MLRTGACQQQPTALPQSRGSSQPRLGGNSNVPAAPLFLLLFFLASWTGACKGAPMPSHALKAEQDLQLWNEIDDACSAYLSIDPHLQASSALEEFCFMVMEVLQKPQSLNEKDTTKREELQAPGGIQSRGYFLFRPRNGRRSAGFR